MARKDDVSGEHFEWLVTGRSRNQRAALGLYMIVEANRTLLESDFIYQKIAHQLVGIAFSLWRAVFFSDLTGDVFDQMSDLRKFLQSLIAHNTIMYQTDFTAREWAFNYYLENAFLRLDSLPDQILARKGPALVVGSAKESWTNAQAALDAAIANFAEMIAGYDQD